mmetsp:Transcript_7792/g.18086  ORF Transcript_7792/g.18086 Transcript_7792/m.18086 type:complete len:329 (+) Transcript_7792:346-1332(+)
MAAIEAAPALVRVSGVGSGVQTRELDFDRAHVVAELILAKGEINREAVLVVGPAPAIRHVHREGARTRLAREGEVGAVGAHDVVVGVREAHDFVDIGVVGRMEGVEVVGHLHGAHLGGGVPLVPLEEEHLFAGQAKVALGARASAARRHASPTVLAGQRARAARRPRVRVGAVARAVFLELAGVLAHRLRGAAGGSDLGHDCAGGAAEDARVEAHPQLAVVAPVAAPRVVQDPRVRVPANKGDGVVAHTVRARAQHSTLVRVELGVGFDTHIESSVLDQCLLEGVCVLETIAHDIDAVECGRLECEIVSAGSGTRNAIVVIGVFGLVR